MEFVCYFLNIIISLNYTICIVLGRDKMHKVCPKTLDCLGMELAGHC